MKRDIVLDTSILVEVALATDTGVRLIDYIINERIKPYTTSLNVVEAFTLSADYWARKKQGKKNKPNKRV
ncbi:MAG: hypothetical protein GSR85_02505 [Desulfurococcales archaeon]|nr:hypothetical protein [Desulfurococcales archaeon]